MGRLIDADLLYKAMQDAEELARRRVRDTESTLPYPTNLNPAYTRYLAQMDERTKVKKMVADAPTVDAVPVVHGRWIERESGAEDKENGFETVIVCSRCDFPATTFYSEDCESRTQIRTDFCPNCGAKMDKEENNERRSGGGCPV